MKKTSLYPVHKELGAKFIEFAEYLMPVQYSSIFSEHKTVRKSVGIFDVSHMGKIFIEGKNSLDFIQHIITNDASKLSVGRVQYTVMCYPDGGIVDDLLIYRLSDDEFMLVVNASNKGKDFEWIKENNKHSVNVRDESDSYNILAVQGPKSVEVLQKICNRTLHLEYYHFFEAKCSDVNIIISRTGYTGEIGFELYFKGDEKTARIIWNLIFESGKEFEIQPIGLGARDTLRLEMGYCLYGNDIDQTTNPLEAGLDWITKFDKPNFIAKDVLLKLKADGLKRKLIPMISEEKAFPRHGYDISVDGKKVGTITSGTVSPILDKAIALGYVDTIFIKEGVTVDFQIRDRSIPAKITKLPFIKKLK